MRTLEAWLPKQFSGRSVLEIACGTGYWTQFIAPAARSVVALDAAPETMAIARDRLGDQHVRFVEADAYAIPSNLGAFDAAFAGFWFSHIPKLQQRAFLTGLKTIFVPGAVVVLIDNAFVKATAHRFLSAMWTGTRIKPAVSMMDRVTAY